MELTAKLVFKINASIKPLARDCFDIRGRTKTGCGVCGGKGGMKGCPTCLGPGMCPDAGGQVRVCVQCQGRGYLFHEFDATVRAQVYRRRRQRAAGVSC